MEEGEWRPVRDQDKLYFVEAEVDKYLAEKYNRGRILDKQTLIEKIETDPHVEKIFPEQSDTYTSIFTCLKKE